MAREMKRWQVYFSTLKAKPGLGSEEDDRSIFSQNRWQVFFLAGEGVG